MLEPALHWVPGDGVGRIAIAARPRGNDWLEDEVAAWARAGVTHVVSLLEPSEVHALGLIDEALLLERHGIALKSFPIADRGVPSSANALAALVASLRVAYESGAAIVVHCRAGIGRSGLVVAALLCSLGQPFDGVFELLTNVRGVAVPDTLDQVQWLGAWCERHARA